jgi:hypothetical protein
VLHIGCWPGHVLQFGHARVTKFPPFHGGKLITAGRAGFRLARRGDGVVQVLFALT